MTRRDHTTTEQPPVYSGAASTSTARIASRKTYSNAEWCLIEKPT